MAYTYNDFLRAAGRTKLLQKFDASDLETTRSNPEYGLSMLSLMQDRDQASTPEVQLLANEAINQLRNNYNVVPTGAVGIASPEVSVENGDAQNSAPEVNTEGGSAQNPSTGTTGTGGDGFRYDREDEYQALLERVTNPGTYSYNPNTDPVLSAYRKMYLQEGDRATQDALAKASAATGGVPSSYAVAAAQQAGANYAERLSDVLPALEQQNFERYLQQLGVTQDAFEKLRYDRAEEYQKYLDQYAMLQEMIEAGGETSDVVPLDDLSYLQQAYPTGMITDQNVWNNLVSVYGEEALKGAGYSFSAAAQVDAPSYDGLGVTLPGGLGVIPAQGGGESIENATSVDMSTLWDLGYGMYTPEAVAALVANGTLVQYVENGVLKFRKGNPQTAMFG